MKRKLVFAITIGLVVVVLLSLILSQSLRNNKNDNQIATPSFFVGVEYAYGYNNQTSQVQLNQLQALVEKVKDYTNLFVIGSLGLTFDQTALSQACDYISNHSNLFFIVLFTGLDKYHTYNITTWMKESQQKYGERFLGIYRYDEPGGRTLDQGIDPLVYKANVSKTETFTDVANTYVNNLKVFPNFYLQYSPKVFTADYGLYWFDYAAGYSTIFAEFVGNESRERHIALCRGAADAFNRDWGVIINWKYNQAPYIENASELLVDLHMAYDAGAKYSIVFSYPQIPIDGYFGILNQTHFDTLATFWNYIKTNPQNLTVSQRQAAYVLPAGYGYGFRNANDTIWGIFPADNISWKVFCDTDTLIQKYGSHFDILYDQSPLTSQLLECYNEVYYWNQTVS
jgi:hypothetical protein